MASTHTTRNRFEKQASGENQDTWGDRLNTKLIDMVDEALDGFLDISIAGSGDTTLTASNGLTDQSRQRIISLSGILTGASNVIVPTQERWWVFKNITTAAYATVVKTSAGTGITLPQGETSILYCDGTNVEYLSPVRGWGAGEYAAATGTDTYAATLTPAPTVLTTGMRVTLKFANANSTAATINLNSLGAKNIYRNGAALTAAEIPANGVLSLTYDGTQFNMDAARIYLADVIDSGTAAALTAGVANTNVPQMDATGYPAADGSQITAIAVANLTGGILPRGYIDGLIISNDATDAAKDIGIAAGATRDGANAVDITLASALIKKLDAAWAVGTNQGALDGTESVTGTPDASTWYHIWLIRRSDTGVVDILASEHATAPTMPTNYDQKRRIGAVLFDATPDIIPFFQEDNIFRWKTLVQDYYEVNPGTSAVTRALTVPTGLKVRAIHVATIVSTQITACYVLVTSLDETDSTPSISLFNIATSNSSGANSARFEIITNSLSQIRTRLSTSSSPYKIGGNTLGWIDPRGRNA